MMDHSAPMEIVPTLFLIACFLGAVIAVWYTIRILHCYLFDFEAKEVNVSLLQVARNAVTHLRTPIFGEPEWNVMLGWVVLALIYRAGWHNSIKLVNQLEWHMEDSTEESHSCQTHSIFFPSSD
jgi:hypothetical protein